MRAHSNEISVNQNTAVDLHIMCANREKIEWRDIKLFFYRIVSYLVEGSISNEIEPMMIILYLI